ncbi:MAG: 1-acyl-sn-glycerol-3-phosphate acyltransferase [Gammaproteobacteria bacterium]|nr:1-acyl-sn-glycerol-3-phosphate acyltransferase [Gammaproteobacteria bacterium]MCF6230630.1 1-acyl-sn-glycerol-3-phosphate acyltransferase [Gammaproteobacteria bacterium]
MFLRSLMFTLGSLLALVVISLVGLLLFPLPFKIRYAWITRWAWFNLHWLRITCGINYVIEGWENVPEKPCIVFSKHQSTFETYALQVILPPQAWVLKRELLWVPIFGWGLALCRPIAIDRGAGRKAVKQIIEQGTERLQQGQWVLIFPEGTRVAPGEKKKYGMGGAILANKSGYPVLPVAHNAGEFWRKKQFVKTPGTVRLVFGPLIDSKGKEAQEINEEAKAWMEAKATEILNSPQPK